MKREQTTFTFSTHENAEKFSKWLRDNVMDRDVGSPKFIDMRQVGHEICCVEYSAEGEFARGVATGIDMTSVTICPHCDQPSDESGCE